MNPVPNPLDVVGDVVSGLGETAGDLIDAGGAAVAGLANTVGELISALSTLGL